MQHLARASVVVLAGLQAVRAKPVDAVASAFDEFINNFKKAYSEEEKAIRFEIFQKNFDLIQTENAKGHKYTLGVTEFTDLTRDEFRKTHLGLRKGSKAFSGLPYLGRHQVSNTTVPKTVDWRKEGAVTPVKNQQQCGSCWAFSSTGSLEGAWKIASGNLVSLSEQQLVDCSGSFGNQGCNGGEMDDAFQYAETVGFCTEGSYPYTAVDGTCAASSCTVGVPQGGVTGFKDVTPGDYNALLDAVAQQPVSVAIEADQSVFQLYTGGVITGDSCGTNLDHGVLAVGYGTESGTDYWLVKNSWGASWGDSGYVKLQRGQSGNGECGIQMDPSYPVVQASATINI